MAAVSATTALHSAAGVPDVTGFPVREVIASVCFGVIDMTNAMARLVWLAWQYLMRVGGIMVWSGRGL